MVVMSDELSESVSLFPLGSQGAEFARNSIAERGGEVSQRLLALPWMGEARAWSWARPDQHDGLARRRKAEFRQSGPRVREASLRNIANIMVRHLEGSREARVVLLHPLALLADSYEPVTRFLVVQRDSGAFLVGDYRQASTAEVTEAVMEAEHLPGMVGFMGSSSIADPLEVASNASAIFVPAFHTEGYVMLTPAEVSPAELGPKPGVRAQPSGIIDLIRRPRSSSFVLAVGSPTAIEATFVLHGPEERDHVVRIIRGARCQTRERFFQEISAAFQIPGWTSFGWDLLHDVLPDVAFWLPAKSYTMLVMDAVELLTDPVELEAFVEILAGVADQYRTGGWIHPPGPLRQWHTVFHTTLANEAATKERLHAAGCQLSEQEWREV